MTSDLDLIDDDKIQSNGNIPIEKDMNEVEAESGDSNEYDYEDEDEGENEELEGNNEIRELKVCVQWLLPIL